ncbi:MAG: GGDEF domain-containing protein [Lachnospiraceae bacterium]|nr:GGDEF domain-containing protein [Lachnospiraceae bacterium]
MSMEMLYSIIYLEINLFCVLLLVIIRVKTLGLSRMVAQVNFSMAVDSTALFFIADTVWVLTENNFLPYSKFVILASKDVYFLASSIMCYFWFVYFEYLQDSPFVKNKRRMWSSTLFVWVQLILIITNHFTNILYYVDADNVYHRGPLFILLYLFSYAYVLVTCSRALVGSFQKENAAKKPLLIRLALFPVAPAIGGLIQFFVPRLPVICGMLALSTLIIYLDALEQMISIDPLTRLNNRKQLMFHYDQRIKDNDDHIPVYLLMIDANRFKSINDTYGHVEGDAALIRVADALKHGCGKLKRRANIARYGGDEFVILAKAENDRIIEELIADIRAHLKELNEAAKAPYELTISIGVAHTDGQEEPPFKQLAEEADKKLYEEKARLK